MIRVGQNHISKYRTLCIVPCIQPYITFYNFLQVFLPVFPLFTMLYVLYAVYIYVYIRIQKSHIRSWPTLHMIYTLEFNASGRDGGI
jgi:hypothetical protein